MKAIVFAFLFCIGSFLSLAQTAPEPAHPILKQALLDIRAFREQERKLDQNSGFPLGLHGAAAAKRSHDFALEIHRRIQQIDRSGLSFADEINAELLLYSLEDDISDYQYRSYLNPLLSEGGFHTNITGMSNTVIRNAADASDYLKRLSDVPRYMEEHFGLIREGLAVGIAQPYDVIKSFNNTYEIHIVEKPEQSQFWKPFQQKPSGISDAEWQKNIDRSQGNHHGKGGGWIPLRQNFFRKRILAQGT